MRKRIISSQVPGRTTGRAFVAIVSLLVGVAARGADWPRFLGPGGNNISTETGLLERWPATGPPVRWDREIGSGYGAPSVLGDWLVLHHRLQNEEVLEAFAPATGETRWRFAYPSYFRDPFGYNNGPRGTPLLTTNRCFAFGAEGRLVCLDLRTGALVWQRETAREWNVPEPFFGVGSTPLLEGNRLMVMVGGQPNAGVVALDPETGKTLWESAGRDTWNGVTTVGWRAERPYHWTGFEKLASYSTPVAATIHGRRHLLCLTRQGLVSLNPTNGAVHFRRWFQSPVNESVNAMCPVVWDDLVLISAAYYRIGAVVLQVDPGGQAFRELWRSPVDPTRRDPQTGRFPDPVLEIHWNTPVLSRGFLYAFSGRNEPDATFRCVEFKTGRLMWSRDESWPGHTGRPPAVYGRGSAILADDRLVVLGEGGKLGLFRPNPEHPDEICSFQPPQLRFPCWAAPVLAQKLLYLRGENRLLCLDLHP